jgi:hypothetical protein
VALDAGSSASTTDRSPSRSVRVPEVSEVSREDYEKLAKYLAAFPEDQSQSSLSWLSRMHAWWDLNPAFEDSFARGWFLQDDGKIVGFLGSIPRKFQLGGNETTIFAGTTWRVLPEFRGMSVALKRRQMDEHRDALHFSTTPTAEVARMLELLGYATFNRGPRDGNHSAIILNFEKVLRTRLQRATLGEMLAKRLAPVLGAIQSRLIRNLKHCRHSNVRVFESAGKEFDDLWKRTRLRYANTSIRTADAINWYCFSSQVFEKTLLGYFEGHRLVGYMVFLSTEKRGMKFFECVDSWIEPVGNQTQVRGALVEKARQYAEQGSFDRVFLPHFDRDTAGSYARLGLIAMRSWGKPGYLRGPRHLMDQITTATSYFVLAEGDYGL